MLFSQRSTIFLSLCLVFCLATISPAPAEAARILNSYPRIYDGAGGDASKCGKGDCSRWIVKFNDEFMAEHPDEIDDFCLELAGLFKRDRNASSYSRSRRRRFAGRCARQAKKFGFAVFKARYERDATRYVRRHMRGKVDYIERDLAAHAVRATDLWGLDRTDQRALPLDDSYTLPFNVTGSNVHVYVIDTGINADHTEFAGRVGEGMDFASDPDDEIPDDCNGHGTHCAGTVLGTNFGVAPGATLHGVKVLNCGGSGSFGDVISGMEWVADNHELMHPGTQAVVSMSLGGGFSQAVNDAVDKLVDAGITTVVAAGNSNTDACTSSPASAPRAITVGATASDDKRAGFSNYGRCVDIFAPGVGIKSAWIGGDNAENTISGTSMATPHVAGVAALYA